MAVEHKDLTGASLHEPKGVESATVGQVYQADGVGSGTWVDGLATLKNRNLTSVVTRIPDISTPGSVFVAVPIAGVITKIYVVLHGTIAAANSIVTAKIGGVAVGGISITCTAAGSVGGSTFTGTATSARTLTAGQALEIITDGGATNTVSADVTVVVDVT